VSAIASQFAAGIDQAMSSLGVAGVYTRGDTGASLPLQVALSSPEYEAATESGVLITASRWDIYLRTRDLAFDGKAHDPRVGDSVVITVGGRNYTYTALVPDGRRFCWTWADRFRVRRKLFTKLTAFVNA